MNANSLKKIEWTGRHQSIPTPNPVPHLPSYQNHKFFPEWSCDIVQTNECEQVLLGMVSRKVTVFLTKRTRISTYHAHASLCSLLVSCLKCRVRSRTTAAIPPPWQQKLPTKDGEAEGETSGSLNKGATQHLVSSLHMTGINNNYTQLILREMQPRAEHSRDTSHLRWSPEALRGRILALEGNWRLCSCSSATCWLRYVGRLTEWIWLSLGANRRGWTTQMTRIRDKVKSDMHRVEGLAQSMLIIP